MNNPFFYQAPTPALSEKREGKHIGRVALAVAAVPVLSLVAQLLLILPLQLFGLMDDAMPMWLSLALSSAAMYLVAMPLAYLILQGSPRTPRQDRSLRPLEALSLLAVSLALTFAGSIMGTLVNAFLSLLTGKDLSNPVADLTEQVPIGALILFVVILAPIMEELFFRRLLIDRLRRFGDLPAIVISGLAFGLIHGNFSQFFYATFMGLVFGVIYCYTGRLRYPVILHMFINFFGSVYSVIMLRALGDIPDIPDLAYLTSHLQGFLMMAGYYAIYGLAFVACIPAAFLLLRRIRPALDRSTMSVGKLCSTLLGSPAVWIALVVLGVNFLLNML